MCTRVRCEITGCNRAEDFISISHKYNELKDKYISLVLETKPTQPFIVGEEYNKLQKEYADLKEKYDDLDSDFDNLNADNDETLEENSELEERLDLLESCIKDIKSVLRDINMPIRNICGVIDSRIKDLDEDLEEIE